MRKIWLVNALLVAGLMLAPTAAQAATINYWSGDGNDVLVSAGSLTLISPHVLWGDVSDNAGLALDTAKWISYANTGPGGSVAPDAASRNVGDATAEFTQTLNISSNGGGSGTFNLWVLTDDTAEVHLIGPGIVNPVIAVTSSQGITCSGEPIGCLEADMGVAGLTGLLDGVYTMHVYAFQTDGDVFGSQYAGNYSQADAAVPEPASLLLLGTGLLGVARARKRRNVVRNG